MTSCTTRCPPLRSWWFPEPSKWKKSWETVYRCRLCVHRTAIQAPGPIKLSRKSHGSSKSPQTHSPSNSLFSSASARNVGLTSRRPGGPTTGSSPPRKTRRRIASGSSSPSSRDADYLTIIVLSRSHRSSGRATPTSTLPSPSSKKRNSSDLRNG